jgi:4-hydroxy-2-oxoheptanedioate aldolase
MRVLDLGVEGIMCPRIKDASEAKNVVNSLRYPPEGSRGVAKIVRATGFGKNFSSYFRDIKENILGIAQIETPEALNHLDEIASLDGIDVLFIGPADLSMSLGIFGQFDHPLFTDALKATIEAAEKAGKATGILLPSPDEFKTYHQMGIRMIACGADVVFVKNGAQQMADQLNKYVKQKKID